MPFFDHYPYTNLHNVNLDWVLQAVKSWGAMVEQNNQNFIDLQAANESFKEYVTGYITNLDVQEEINNKLDAMLESGELVPYLQPYIVTEVENWLEQHITPTTPALDDTLSISGAAADAKAAGDAISRVSGSVIYPDFIPYDYTTPADLAPTATSGINRLGVKRSGIAVIFNTVNDSTFTTANTYVQLNDIVKRVSSIAELTGGFSLISGHLYKATLLYVSGTSRQSGSQNVFIPTIVIINASNASLIENEETLSDRYIKTFIADDSAEFRIAIYVRTQLTFTKAQFAVYLEDMTQQQTDLESDLANIEFNTLYGTPNLFSRYDAVKGGIRTADGVLADTGANTTRRASDYIPVTGDSLYFVKPQYTGVNTPYGIAFYDTDKVYISGLKQGYMDTNPRNIPFAFRTPQNAAYCRFTMYYTQVETAYFAPFSVGTLEKLGKNIEHEGESVNIVNKPSIDIVSNFKFEISTGHQQGGAIFNGFFFLFQTNSAEGLVINLTDYTTAAITLDVNPNHSNIVQFSNNYYDQSDVYPLLMIAGQENRACQFYRITNTGSGFTGTLITKINYPTLALNTPYVDCAINNDFNTLMIKGKDSANNNIWIVYDMPAFSSTELTLESVPESGEHPLGYIKILPFKTRGIATGHQYSLSTQDCFIKDNLMYRVNGFGDGTTANASACLNVIDCSTGEIITFIDLKAYIIYEPEAIDYYDGRIIIIDNNGIMYFLYRNI